MRLPADRSSELGLAQDARTAVVQELSRLLADTAVLSLKTQHFHWNVTGPLFYSLHKLTEAQYEELVEATDTLAERIRALGEFAPGTYSAFSRMSELSQDDAVPPAEEMVRQLLEDHGTIIRRARASSKVAEEHHDQASQDLLADRMAAHEKQAWMLRSLLEGSPAHAAGEA
jgi:starvation-inducible DNA-binding protein